MQLPPPAPPFLIPNISSDPTSPPAMIDSLPLAPPVPPSPPAFELQKLKALAVLGRGAKGVVFHIQTTADASDDALALKAISRYSIESKSRSAEKNGDAYRRIWLERDALLALRHPLLPSLRGVVSTDKIVGFVIDRCSGGDLNSLRRRQTEKMFSDDVIRFYAAELVLALEYLHGLGFVYRDLKPENVLIQENGHIMLVDFDLSTKLPSPVSPVHPPPTPPSPSPTKAKKKKSRSHLQSCLSCNAGVSPETHNSSLEEAAPGASDLSPESGSGNGSSTNKSNSFVGTEEYVAPEIIQGCGHDFAVDWWGLGVVLYELLYGRTPFRGQNRKETFYRILTKEPELIGEPTSLRDLIRKLLEKDPEKRIRVEEIKNHPFFRGVDWEEILQVARPPFIPPAAGAEWEEKDSGILEIDVEKTVEQVLLAKEKIKANQGDNDNNNNNN